WERRAAMSARNSGLTLLTAKDWRFSARRGLLSVRESYTHSLSVPSCEEVPVYPTVPVRSPGRLTTSQVVQVDRLVLATLGPRLWLLFYVGAFPPQPPTATCQ